MVPVPRSAADAAAMHMNAGGMMPSPAAGSGSTPYQPYPSIGGGSPGARTALPRPREIVAPQLAANKAAASLFMMPPPPPK